MYLDRGSEQWFTNVELFLQSKLPMRLAGYFHLNVSVERWRQKIIFLWFAGGQAVFPFGSFIVIMITPLPTLNGVSMGPSLFLIRSTLKTKFWLCLKSSSFFLK